MTRDAVFNPNEIRIFNNSGSRTLKRDGETREIRSFLESWSPYSALVKEETSKKTVLQLLNSVCINVTMAKEMPKLVVLFDHDRKTPHAEFSGIRNTIKSSKKGIDLVQVLTTKHGDIAHSSTYELHKVGRRGTVPITQIHFFCFYLSLEKAAKREFGSLPIPNLINKMAELFNAKDVFSP